MTRILTSGVGDIALDMYHHVADGEQVIYRHATTVRLACCDCGLVHDIEVRVGIWRGVAKLRFWRNHKETATRRSVLGIGPK